MKVHRRIHANDTFYCGDCLFVFTLHTKRTVKHHPFCPNCGDCVSVRVHKEKETKYVKRPSWEAWEIELVDRVIKGEILTYQAALKIKRTPKAIKNKIVNRRKELTQKNDIVT